MDEKLEKLLKKILNKTTNKKATWEKGARDNQFILNLSIGALTMDRWNSGTSERVDVEIYNQDGEQITYFKAHPESTLGIFISEVHSAASASYYKVDEILDSMDKEVSGSDTIGVQENTASDDDINL